MPISLYQRVAEDLVGKLTAGTYAIGSILPTELELMESYGTSRNTIRAALKQLEDMGLISRRRNRGTMVESKPVPGTFTQSLSTLDDLVTLAKSAQRHVVRSKESVMNTALAKELGAAPGSTWLHIEMTRTEEGAIAPLAWTDAYVDPHYTKIRTLAAKFPDRLLCDLIETTYGRMIATVEQKVDACAIPASVAALLQVPESTPGLRILRRYRDPARVLALITRSYYPAGRYALTTTLTRHS